MRKTSFLCMVLFVNLMDTNSSVFGEVITATPGQNVSLPCNNDNMNDGSVRWFTHSDYISTGSIIHKNSSLGLQATHFAIPGEGADYSLFIMIPDDNNIWSYIDGDYECRLTSSGVYSVLSEVTLHICNLCKSQEGTDTDPGSTAGASSEAISSFETSITTNTPSTTFLHTSIITKEVTSTMENSDSTIKVETSFTEYNSTSLSVESKTIRSTEFSTRNKQTDSTKNPEKTDILYLIVIMSIAFIIILFLIIFIIYCARRRPQYKQNPSFKSAPPDDHEYVEVDLKVNPTTKGENQEMMKNNEESVMEENQIYESADMNGKQNTDEQKKEIRNVIVDGDYTNRIYKTGEQVHGQSTLNKSAPENSNEDGTNDGIVYHENEAYESLDDININNDKLDQKESDKKGNKIPAYVHYEVLERE